MTDKIKIDLTKDEAIVLFEFLSRFNKNIHEEMFEDKAEQQVLWDIECLLEKELVEPFHSDYRDIVKRAREIVKYKKEE